MTAAALLELRLRNQQLLARTRRSALDVVSPLGAVQSQDFPSACWAVGQRAIGLSEVDVLRAFDQGAIVRTHVLRPTWHFVAPADLRWMLRLTGPRVRAIVAGYHRKVGIDARAVSPEPRSADQRIAGGPVSDAPRAHSRIRQGALAGRAAERILPRDGRGADGPRLQRTAARRALYVRAGRRACARAPVLDRDAAVAELTRRYFTSHGPATTRDFAWWSGLTQRDAREGLEHADSFEQATVDGVTYWFAPQGAHGGRRSRPIAHLLPNYAQGTRWSRNWTVLGGLDIPRDESGQSLQHGLVIDGQLAGGWRRTLSTTEVHLAVVPARRLLPAEVAAVEAASADYERFVGVPVRLTVTRRA